MRSYIPSTPGCAWRRQGCYNICMQSVLICTHSKMCLACALAMAALHGCMRVYIHSDNWLEPCRADGIVMTSASTAHPDAIGSSITWNGTWLLVLSWPACLPACLPARGKAVGQSHFQQINLIWKFSSPCNLKQQQQGSSSPPTLNSFRSRRLPLFFFFLALSSPRRNYWMRGGRGGTEGWMSARREGGRERGMVGGRLVIISKGHSVNDYPLG